MKHATFFSRIHMIARLIRWYRHRWGIENGYKKIKAFMVRTTSTCPRYRFFNFMFACVLYNVWRLVDLLVKLSLEVHPDYAPRDFSMVSDGRCVNLPGFVDVEAGFQGSEQAVRNAYECLVAFLQTNGVLSGSIQDTETTLYEVFDTVEKEPDSRYRFVRSNFEFVAEGTTFAKSDETKLQAEQDFWPVLMSDDGHSTLFGYKTTLVGSLDAA